MKPGLGEGTWEIVSSNSMRAYTSMLIIDKENASAVRVQFKIAHRQPEEFGGDVKSSTMNACRS